MFIANPDEGVSARGLRTAALVLMLALLAPGAIRASGPARGAGPAYDQARMPLAKARPQPQGQSAVSPSDTNPAPLTPKQQRALLKSNYTKMKEDADELAALAKSLQEELNKSNENVLSLDVVEKADKIEKLAKRIRNAAVH